MSTTVPGFDRAELVIDLDAIEANVAVLREAAGGRTFMSVVKADGYGHGMIASARAARAAGSEYLGVALPGEAMQLRSTGDRGRLMCWLYPPAQDLSECVGADVELSVASVGMVEQVSTAATKAGRPARIHLKVDSGLGRNGAQPADWERVVRASLAAQRVGAVEIIGIWSHLATADQLDTAGTQAQTDVFAEALASAALLGLDPPLRHLASSGAVLAHAHTHYDMVRCGISIYGLSPGPALGSAKELGLTPAMTFRSRVVLVKKVPADHGVSYGLRYRTAAATRLALIPVGYADGVPRAGSGRVPVMIGEQRFVVAGTVAMDQVVVDIGDASVRAGDEVTMFCNGAHGAPTADDWAVACDTINYEIVTRMGTRVPRRFEGSQAQ